MKQVLFVVVIFFSTILSIAQTLSEKDKSAIHNVMVQQEKCWNAGDIECGRELDHRTSDNLQQLIREKHKGLIDVEKTKNRPT